jgi:nitric oxide reductase activation protein
MPIVTPTPTVPRPIATVRYSNHLKDEHTVLLQAYGTKYQYTLEAYESKDGRREKEEHVFNYLDATQSGRTLEEAKAKLEKEVKRHIKQRRARAERLLAEIAEMEEFLAGYDLVERK